MGGGMPKISELRARGAARASLPAHEILTQREMHEQMRPKGITARECLASDTSPNPLPIMCFLDTSGSMGHVPRKLAVEDLPRTLVRLTEMGAVGQDDPQLCFCGVADTNDHAPIQLGQFERDNRMDDWLTRLFLGGGAGPESYHENYPLAMYAALAKTRCDIHKRERKGHLFIAGDEMCPKTLFAEDVRKIFGDRIDNMSTQSLLEKLRAQWNITFLFVATDSYGTDTTPRIWKSWQQLLGEDALRLDREATGLPEIMSARIGIADGHFRADDVPNILVGIGVEDEILFAVTTALGLSREQHPLPVPGERKRRRGPTPV